MVQANSTFIEGNGIRWIGESVQPDERLTFNKPDSSSKRARAFVPVQRHVEESFVPMDTAVEVTDCQGHMGDRRDLKHEASPWSQ